MIPHSGGAGMRSCCLEVVIGSIVLLGVLLLAYLTGVTL